MRCTKDFGTHLVADVLSLPFPHLLPSRFHPSLLSIVAARTNQVFRGFTEHRHDMVWVPAAWRGSLHASATLSFLLCPAAVASDIALLEVCHLHPVFLT